MENDPILWLKGSKGINPFLTQALLGGLLLYQLAASTMSQNVTQRNGIDGKHVNLTWMKEMGA